MIVAFGCSIAIRAARRDQPPPTWQSIASTDDEKRLHLWRVAWLDGLRLAEAADAGVAITAAGAVLDPDSALPDAAPTDGVYRCRVYKLGGPTLASPGFKILPMRPCELAGGHFAMLSGGQRPAGRLWPYEKSRLVFLGAVTLGDESGSLDYGRDNVRNMIGLFERVGEQRWRIVLPRPRWESQIDVIEIVPAA